MRFQPALGTCKGAKAKGNLWLARLLLHATMIFLYLQISGGCHICRAACVSYPVSVDGFGVYVGSFAERWREGG